jgi:acetylornithine/succinyldiaminopimelate/putrescine aminotransferase
MLFFCGSGNEAQDRAIALLHKWMALNASNEWFSSFKI